MVKKAVLFFLFFVILISSSFSQLFEFAKHELRLYWGDAYLLGTISNSFETPLQFRNNYDGVAGSFNFDYTYDLKPRIGLGFAVGFARNYQNVLVANPGLNEDTYTKMFYNNIHFSFLMKITYFKTEFFKLYGAFSIGPGFTLDDGMSFTSLFPAIQITAFGMRAGTDMFGFFVEFGAGTTGIINAGLLLNIY